MSDSLLGRVHSGALNMSVPYQVAEETERGVLDIRKNQGWYALGRDLLLENSY